MRQEGDKTDLAEKAVAQGLLTQRSQSDRSVTSQVGAQ